VSVSTKVCLRGNEGKENEESEGEESVGKESEGEGITKKQKKFLPKKSNFSFF
jgi:hypothetical protein